MKHVEFNEAVPATLAILSLLALTGAHWLQMPESSAAAIGAVLGGATTLYFVNKGRNSSETPSTPPQA